MTTDAEVHQDAMIRAITDMASILHLLQAAIGDLGALRPPAASCGQVGAPVASASTDLHAQAVQAAGQLQQTLDEANKRLAYTLAGYRSYDARSAAAQRAVTRLRPTW